MGEPNLGSWLTADDEPDAEPPPDSSSAPGNPRRRIWLLAAGPWLVAGVAVLLWQPWQSTAGEDEPAPAVTDTADQPPAEQVVAEGTDTGAELPASEEPAAAVDPMTEDLESTIGASSSAPIGAHEAVATAAVRMAVHQAGDDRVRYVDHAVAESTEVHDGFSVVRVVAVVMDAEDDDTWGAPALRRYGVAVVDDAQEPWVLGEPWPLPAPAAAAEPAEGTPVEDPDTLDTVADAITAAGYADPTVDAVTSDPALPLLHATVTATAPAEEHPATHHVWLSSEAPDRLLGDDDFAPSPAPDESQE